MGAFPTPSLTEIARTTGLRGFSPAFVTSVGCRASWFNAFHPRQGFARADADPASVARRSAAIAALQRANPGLRVSLTLLVLPEGLTADGRIYD
jgi:hypothetical protein